MYNQDKNPFNSPIVKVDMEDGVLGKANDDGTIHINKNVTDPKQIKEIVEHESVHIDQMKRGDLSYNDNSVTWKGKKYSRAKMNEGAKNLPWEKEAYEKAEDMKKFKMKGSRGQSDPYSTFQKRGLINSPLHKDPPKGSTLPTATATSGNNIDKLLSDTKYDGEGNYSLGKTRHMQSGKEISDNNQSGYYKAIGGDGFDLQAKSMYQLSGKDPKGAKYNDWKNELRKDSAKVARDYKLAQNAYSFLDDVEELKDGSKEFTTDSGGRYSYREGKDGQAQFSVYDTKMKAYSSYKDWDNTDKDARFGGAGRNDISQYSNQQFNKSWNESNASKLLSKYDNKEKGSSYKYDPDTGKYRTVGVADHFGTGTTDQAIIHAKNKLDKTKINVPKSTVLPTSTISSKPKGGVVGTSVNEQQPSMSEANKDFRIQSDVELNKDFSYIDKRKEEAYRASFPIDHPYRQGKDRDSDENKKVIPEDRVIRASF
tara:strand:- start:1129 stop:2574 length:1446 start_codon:yes stop_codon:yes gene_type:complete